MAIRCATGQSVVNGGAGDKAIGNQLRIRGQV
jgi:hypothetical protein